MTRLVRGLAFATVPESWRLVVVVVAGATEFLDGALSRLWHVSGAMGRLLDPIADKVFVLAVLATLMAEGWVAFWELLLIGARDVLVLGGCVFVVARRDRSGLTQLPPTRLGKLATTGQLVFLLLILLGWGPVRVVFHVTVLLSVATGWTTCAGGGEAPEGQVRADPLIDSGPGPISPLAAQSFGRAAAGDLLGDDSPRAIPVERHHLRGVKGPVVAVGTQRRDVGWVALRGERGGLIWIVLGRCGADHLMVSGPTRAEAWRRALDQAAAVGMLPGQPRPARE